jgi:hypothetical protein
MRREACTAAAIIAVAQALRRQGKPLRGRAKLPLDRATRRQGNVAVLRIWHVWLPRTQTEDDFNDYKQESCFQGVERAEQ